MKGSSKQGLARKAGRYLPKWWKGVWKPLSLLNCSPKISLVCLMWIRHFAGCGRCKVRRARPSGQEITPSDFAPLYSSPFMLVQFTPVPELHLMRTETHLGASPLSFGKGLKLICCPGMLHRNWSTVSKHFSVPRKGSHTGTLTPASAYPPLNSPLDLEQHLRLWSAWLGPC